MNLTDNEITLYFSLALAILLPIWVWFEIMCSRRYK